MGLKEKFLACSMDCHNRPIYMCDCNEKNVLLCLDHCGTHGELSGNHHFTKLISSPDPCTKMIISSLFKDIKLLIKQSQLKVIQESSSLIKQINDAAMISLKKLSLIEKKADDYIYLINSLEEINNLHSLSLIESLLKLSSEEAQKIKYSDENIVKVNNENFDGKFADLFAVEDDQKVFHLKNFKDFKPKTERNPQPVIKYFINKVLYDLDVRTFISESQNLTINWNSNGPTCLLKDGSVFCCFSSQTFIITPSNSIIHLGSSKYSSYSGLIQVNNFVYLFGGTESISAAFSIKKRHWRELAPYRIYNNRYISCAFLNGEILIGGFESQFIIRYSILGNKFSTIPVALSNCTGKTCLATQNKAYIIEHNRNYYESGLDNIDEWALIGNTDNLADGYSCNSYVLLYEDIFYFITTDWSLVQFNLKNKELSSSKFLID